MGSFAGKSPHVMRLACTNKKVIYVLAKIWVLLSNFQAHNTCRNRRIFWITCSLIQAVMNTNVLRNTSRQASMTSVVEIWGWGVDFCSKSNMEKCICFGLTFNDYQRSLLHLTFQVNLKNNMKLFKNGFCWKSTIWWKSFCHWHIF